LKVRRHPPLEAGARGPAQDPGRGSNAESGAPVEGALRGGEGHYRSLVEGVRGCALFEADEKGRVASWNEGCRRLFLRERDAVLGREIAALCDPSAALGSSLWLAAMREGEDYNGESWMLRGDGTRFLADVAIRARQGAEGASRVFAILVRDMTERRNHQSQIDQSRRLAGLSRLAATVAHEFNNVLMGIQPFAEVLIRKPENMAYARKAGEQILKAVGRGSRISEEILRFTQPEEPCLADLDLSGWLVQMQDALQALLVPSIALHLRIPEGPLHVRGDREQLKRVIANLCINARDSMPDGGAVDIVVDRDGRTEFGFGSVPDAASFVHLSVHDDGRGIAASDLPQVFEPLFTTKRSGTGLGLAVAQQIVQNHGGRIFAESAPGEGTTFHLFLLRATGHPRTVRADKPVQKQAQ
jgi:PAS domain S-box-containing protein